MKEHLIKFGEELSRLRELKGLTKAEFARRARISMGALWKYENGRVLPMRPMVIRLAKALGIAADVLQAIVDRCHRVGSASPAA